MYTTPSTFLTLSPTDPATSKDEYNRDQARSRLWRRKTIFTRWRKSWGANSTRTASYDTSSSGKDTRLTNARWNRSRISKDPGTWFASSTRSTRINPVRLRAVRGGLRLLYEVEASEGTFDLLKCRGELWEQ